MRAPPPEPLAPALLHLPPDTQRFDLPDSPDGGFEASVAAPAVFRHLRLLWGAKLAASLDSDTLYQLGSPGKSGACMFFTEDMRFIIKTVSAEEFHAFDPVSYYHHMTTHRDSLMNRMLVLASMSRSSLQPASPLRRWLGQEDDHVYIIVIENVVPPHLAVSEMYDLKGSTLGRAAGPEAKQQARQSGKSIILKDLDVERCIHLTRDMGVLLLDTLRADLAWLEQHHAMDYSLLLAVVPDETNEDVHNNGDGGAKSICCTCCGQLLPPFRNIPPTLSLSLTLIGLKQGDKIIRVRCAASAILPCVDLALRLSEELPAVICVKALKNAPSLGRSHQ